MQTTLEFPADCDISLEACLLIKQLLVESQSRLDYEGIVRHQFFKTTDWEHLMYGEEGEGSMLLS